MDKIGGPRYSPISPTESLADGNSFATDEKFLAQTHRDEKRWTRPQTQLLALVTILIILISTLIVLVLMQKPSDRQCTEQLSSYSPVLGAVEYVEYDFANAFNSTSIYRGPPNPEREKAWIELTNKHGVEVPANKLPALNRSEQDNLLHVPAEFGTGYAGIIEVFHQLHCLNIIRMFTWLQAGKYDEPPGGLTSTDVGNRMHVDHCIETLRIALMCLGDVTPVLVRVDPSAPLGNRADFNAHHKCRNFDKIVAWVDENGYV